jgi:uncharacterized protein YabE (DUF348 family)
MEQVHSSGARSSRRKVAILATGVVLASLLGAVGTAAPARASSLRPEATKAP